MFGITSRTLLRAGFALAVFCSWPPGASIGQTVSPAATVALTPDSATQVCPAVSGSPPSVTAGQPATLTFCTNGTIDLSLVTNPAQIGVRPKGFISNIKIIDAFPQKLIFTTDVAPSAEAGLWTLFVNDTSGHEVIALNFFITAPSGGCNLSNCPPPKVCSADGQCVVPGCVNCQKLGRRCLPGGVCGPPL
jgi:hypothetical protein